MVMLVGSLAFEAFGEDDCLMEHLQCSQLRVQELSRVKLAS